VALYLRKLKNFSQARLAEAADLPRTTLTHIESGDANPALSKLVEVAMALQLISPALSAINIGKDPRIWLEPKRIFIVDKGRLKSRYRVSAMNCLKVTCWRFPESAPLL
jgi:transcriptional regulator with XRE-family HTH domain